LIMLTFAGRGSRQAGDYAPMRRLKLLASRRAPQSSGVLATAGGVVFAGALDRVFAAYDDANGSLPACRGGL
ncbi:MAG TPA: hypothetical protein VFY29_09015, partial [Terriglobia bacterium]|nr:hypothetical protein [Terriglobia bacterium]